MRAGRTSRAVIVGAAGITLALTAAGCGSGSKPGGSSSTGGTSAAATTSGSSASTASSSSSGAGGVDAAAAALVPAAIKGKGTLTIATDPSYPPNESKDQNGNIVGWDVDMGNAIGAKLGLKVTFANVTFDSIVTGISTGKYDAGMSSITDNKDREKVDDFVTYFNAGTKLMVPKGNPKNLTDNSPTDLSLCGLTVGVEKGTIQEDPDIPSRNKACKAAGKPDIKKLAQDTQDQINESLSSRPLRRGARRLPGRRLLRQQRQLPGGRRHLLRRPVRHRHLQEQQRALAGLRAALKDLVTDGTYHQLTTKYGIQAGDYTTPGLNRRRAERRVSENENESAAGADDAPAAAAIRPAAIRAVPVRRPGRWVGRGHPAGAVSPCSLHMLKFNKNIRLGHGRALAVLPHDHLGGRGHPGADRLRAW